MEKGRKRLSRVYKIGIPLLWLLINGLAVGLSGHLTGDHIAALLLGNVILIAMMVYLIWLFRLNGKLEQFSDARIELWQRRSFYLLGLVMFVLPFFFMIHLPETLHKWDYFTIFNVTTTLHGAEFSSSNLSELAYHYFLRYPNNQFFGIVFNVLFAPFAKSVFLKNVMVTGFASLMLTLGMLATSRLVVKLSGKRLAFLFDVAASGFIPFYVYGAQLYTDTLTLPFVAGASLFFVNAYQAKCRKKQWGWLILAVFVTAVGYAFKPTVAIDFIAALVFLVINRKWRRALVILLVFGGFFVGQHVMVKSVIATQPGYTQEMQERYNFPMMHWIMMSWSPKADKGGFNLELRQYTQSIPGKAAKNRADQQLFLDNLRAMGIGGVIRQIGRKLAYTWTYSDLDSSFYTYRHENPLFYRYFDYLPQGAKRGTGNFIGWFMLKAAEMLYWIPLVLLLWKQIFSQLFSPRKWGNPWGFLMIAVFGLSVFLILWEANSRYLFSFLPLMVAIAVYQLNQLQLKNYGEIMKNEEK